MSPYERTHRLLHQLLGNRGYRRIGNEPYLPLTVEKLEGQPLVSLCHYGEQNGDLMRDPEVVFLLRENEAMPIYFRNDYAGVEHATVSGYFGGVPVLPGAQAPLDHFSRRWLRNLEEQGFFARAEQRCESSAEQCEPGPDVDGGPDLGP